MARARTSVRTCGLAALLTLVSAASLTAPSFAADGAVELRRGGYVTTGGTLDFGRDARPVRRKAESPGSDPFWLYDLVERLLADPVEPQRKPRRLAPRRPAHAAAPGVPSPSTPSTTGPVTGRTTTVLTDPAVAPAANVITGAIDRTPQAPSTLPEINRDDLDAAIIGDAGISQAREDLVKLELARRTYDETRLSGASAFDTRIDWRVLERSRDAWNQTELATAVSAGFEANTYINDNTRTIVVAIAGSQDLRRDFIEANLWHALIQAQAPQQFFLAKSYIRSVQARYQAAGYVTECVGHSLGGGACAYAAAELGIRAVVVNPISAGRLNDLARNFVTNYVVDGDIASAVYQMRGNELSGDVQKIRSGREALRQQLKSRYGVLAGPILVVRDLQNAVKVHQIERALDIIAAYANTARVK